MSRRFISRCFPRSRRVHLIGMVHVRALPGSPLHHGHSVDQIIEAASSEAQLLEKHGFDSVLVENMFDLPYLNGNRQPVGHETTAVMTAVCRQVRADVNARKPVGIQILAGGNLEAMAVALAANLQYIRAEGFVFGHLADEGLMSACAGQLLRYRKMLGLQDTVSVLVDIKKKHSSHAITSDLSAVDTAKAAQFFLADGLILTGPSTGSEADPDELHRVRAAVGSTDDSAVPVLIGSGVTPDNAAKFKQADAFIVGSSLKHGGLWHQGLDERRLAAMLPRVDTGPATAVAKHLMECNRYLFWCANDHLDFRIHEFEAIAKVFELELEWLEKPLSGEPWLILKLSSDDLARCLLSRSMSAHCCVQLWAEGSSRETLHESLRQLPASVSAPFVESSFRLNVEAFMKRWSHEEKVRRFDEFSYLPMRGPVSLKQPEVTLSLFEFYGLDPNRLSESPTRLFFGRLIQSGQRDLIQKLSLKSRCFIANTSMDPALSCLMANLACVKSGSLVLDPFVGSASILVAAAQFGAHVVGSDIDYLTLHARTRPSRVGHTKRVKGEHIRGNFEQYGLQAHFVDVVVADNSCAPWRIPEQGLFDAIITDPPYGIREPAERIGTSRAQPQVPKQYLDSHFPQKVDYQLADIFADLLDAAALWLVEGGRLVFWIPVSREHYSADRLPRHPQLQLVANCEQVLSCHTSRRCLVMEKRQVADDSAAADRRVDSLHLADPCRHNFLQAQRMSRAERKERIRKFGHLNVSNLEQPRPM